MYGVRGRDRDWFLSACFLSLPQNSWESPRVERMWSFSNTVGKIRLRKISTEPNLACSDFSDDDAGSSSSREERLECPICWESFNIVENVPYVLWCGHTLCQNCVLGLQWAVLKLHSQKVKIPFFVSCPWCNLLSLRFVYRGNLKFPRKNYFILWMIERLNGDRVKSCFPLRGDNQPIWSPRRSLFLGHHPSNHTPSRPQCTQSPGQIGPNPDDDNHIFDNVIVERPQLSLHKFLDFFIHFAAKFPLIIVFLAIIFLAIPGSAAILLLYLLITILLALPSFLVLYFAYPILHWLVREITN
ncbi:hypothetical protein Nepgr_033022 [Nepenthes gracilis]|uniref:RING-type domain-containing protein n=1 Tax=Nepenthes gracilis TaxID=150966 RepID=A0AAD3TL54_NEPGR|nr:hypothetical protein Nepgr_033022 [Nepenthes gracilis]